ncbi:MAG: hypothetical protein A2X94_08400 [Bdellovibrionales bacterium GWB1_55_8]|nr:MAG: hypothetical protein A2X94_08400 [Bdellovibrionales bacterium GWB1_55_8]
MKTHLPEEFHGAWAITGVAGFIGSHLLQALLSANQSVTGLDNLTTGTAENLRDVRKNVTPEAWANFRFIEGDIRDPRACGRLMEHADILLHQAAITSVQKSILEPETTYEINQTGFEQVLTAAKSAGIRRAIYASSGSVYGDSKTPAQKEEQPGAPLSPYASSKLSNELYACEFEQTSGIKTVGLRYFNIFGPRQRATAPYAAVIPSWISKIVCGEGIQIFGDGSARRDFCYVGDAVQMNLLAATAPLPEKAGLVFNTASGCAISVAELYHLLRDHFQRLMPQIPVLPPDYQPNRPGDIERSQGDLNMARSILGYHPVHSVSEGLAETLKWFLRTTNTASPGRLGI